MMKLAHLAVVGALLFSSGCIVVSISPLCPDKDAVFEPALVGTWRESPTSSYTLSKQGENAYRIDIIDREDRGTMTGHLIRLDGTLFLDVMPTGDWKGLGVPEKTVETLDGWYMPLHYFIRVNQVTPSLSVSAVDETWLREYLEGHPAALAHTTRNGDLLLTASTADLQRLFRELAKTPGAFERGTVLTREQ